jgi:hypothetical protein
MVGLVLSKRGLIFPGVKWLERESA